MQATTKDSAATVVGSEAMSLVKPRQTLDLMHGSHPAVVSINPSGTDQTTRRRVQTPGSNAITGPVSERSHHTPFLGAQNMAKKAGKSGFVMSTEILELVRADNSLTGKQVIEALEKKYPKAEINRNSASVAFSNARRELGLNVGRKVKRRRRPVGRSRTGAATPAPVAATTVDLDMLKAAKELLQKCNGDAATAASALRSVAALQMG
jgi:hypothetical protein